MSYSDEEIFTNRFDMHPARMVELFYHANLASSGLLQFIQKWRTQAAIGMALLYVLVNPANVQTDGAYNRADSLMVTLLLQLPLAALILWAVMGLALRSVKKRLSREVNKMQETSWGIWEATVSAKGIRVLTDNNEIELNAAEITRAVQNGPAIVFFNEKQFLFALPADDIPIREVHRLMPYLRA